MPYVVILEESHQHASALAVCADLAEAKAAVFEMEHAYDDEAALVPDERDVTWTEDGPDDLVADSLDGGCTYVISHVKPPRGPAAAFAFLDASNDD